MLHDRSELHSVYSELTFQEKLELARYDLQLIQNAKKMVQHIYKAYDFSLSEQSRDEWWWHLDKIAEENLSFGVLPSVIEMRVRNWKRQKTFFNLIVILKWIE